MKKIIVTAVVVISLCGIGFTQEDQHRKLAEEFLTLTQTDKQMQMMLDQMKAVQNQQLAEEENAQEFMAVQDKVFKIIDQNMSWDKIKDRYIDIYVQAFTENDLKDLINFYKSLTGQKFLSKMPELMTQGMQIGQDIMTKITPQIEELISKEAPAPKEMMNKDMTNQQPPAAK